MPMPRIPMEAPEELLALQPDGVIIWPEITPEEPIPEPTGTPRKRAVAAAPKPRAASPRVAPKVVAPKAAEPRKLTKQELMAMKIVELKELCRERSLPVTGRKAQLLERLME